MDFLSDVKPVLKELLDELLKKYPYASILAQDNYEGLQCFSAGNSNKGK